MRRIARVFILIIILICIDFFSKEYIESFFAGDLHYYVPILGEYIGLQLSYNTGIAFSLPITGIPLQIVTLFTILGICIYYFRIEYPKHIGILDIGYSLIFAGALSHAYERLFIGYVVDFISIKYFAILNFADIFISIGACFIFFIYYVRK